MINKMLKAQFNNRAIRIVVEEDSSLWICMWDICKAIKRPQLLITDPVKVKCKSACKIVFSSEEDVVLELWAIRPRDVKTLVKFVRNENKQIYSLCEKLIQWAENLQSDIKAGNLPLIEYQKDKKEMNDLEISKETISSIEIAKLTGKPHNDIMKAVRAMESAWQKVQGGNFSLLFKIRELPNGGKKNDPYYELTKIESLYIATKFNDEARAKLILRWEQLEKEKQASIVQLPDFTNPVIAARAWADQVEKTLLLEQKNDNQAKVIGRMKPKEVYYDTVINDREYYPTSAIASELGMSYYTLANKLMALGVIGAVKPEHNGGHSVYVPTEKYEDWMETVPVGPKGRKLLQWNKKGRVGIFELINPEMPK